MSTHQETIEQEIDRMATKLRKPIPAGLYSKLYAAQQALVWATCHDGFMSPYENIMNGKVQPPVPSTREGSEDCWVALRQIPS